MTRTLSKYVRITIIAARTFTFWKTWFQVCSSRPEHCQETWGSPLYPPGHLHFEKWISSVFFMTRTLSKNVRIAIVAAGTFTFWKTWFQAWPEKLNYFCDQAPLEDLLLNIYLCNSHKKLPPMTALNRMVSIHLLTWAFYLGIYLSTVCLHLKLISWKNSSPEMKNLI